MQNKLHTVDHPDTSLQTKSRSQDLIFKFSDYRVFLMLLFPLWGLGGYAQQTQPYEWDWAINGGASLGGTGAGFSDEQIYDIKVGTDNNYYFIATFEGPYNTNLKGSSVPSYNNSNTAMGNGANDIFLFSTDCEGQVRWSQTIGGWQDDKAYNLVLDNQNNVYIGANVGSNTTGSGPGIRRPLHFTENDSIPFGNTANGGGLIPQEAFKTTYLVKYSSTGQLINKVTLQGDVTNVPSEFQSIISDLTIDSQGKIHFIVGLLQGTHLDGNVTVPSGFNDLNNPQYYLAVYNSDLTYHSSILLSMSGNFFTPVVRFTYDENANQYYLAGMTSLDITGVTYPFSFDGNPIVNRSFILAFDDTDGSENWRREIYTDPGGGPLTSNSITSLIVDENSDIYIGGRIYRYYNDNNGKVYDPNGTYTYPFTPTPHTALPTVIKLNSDGIVQWIKYPVDFAPSYMSNTTLNPRGLALNGNEIGFGSEESYFIWDGFPQNYLSNHKPDPTLLRFDKHTGMTLGIHRIPGYSDEVQYMTAVAVDSDGNYIVGGSFQANLFMNNNLGITPLISTGESDFFVAKLANSLCGSGNVSTNKFNKLTVNVYPNPTTDIVTIETDENLFNYSVYDINGREIQTGIFSSTNQINLQSASNGVYFVKVSTTQGSSATVKVVKQ